MGLSSASVFNATIASSAVSAAFELGLFDSLANQEQGISTHQFCQEKKIDPLSFRSLIYAMQCFDIIRDENGMLKKGDSFEEFNKDKGYFHWMVKGYSDFLGSPRSLLDLERRTGGKFFKRDGAAIALSGKAYGEKFVDWHVHEWISKHPIKKVADLGCGSAHRILQLVQWVHCNAVGVEIDSGGVAVAREAVKQAGRDDIQIVQGDVTCLTPHSEYEPVDLITSFFMGHDLWPRAKCIEVFQNLRRVFPNVRYFLFCDTFQSKLPPQNALPTFTLGFEVFHAIMAQYIPTLEEWRGLFAEGGWRCTEEIVTDIPFTNIFILQPT